MKDVLTSEERVFVEECRKSGLAGGLMSLIDRLAPKPEPVKPCPFCGSDAKVEGEERGVHLYTCTCTKDSECPMYGLVFPKEQWNKRAS